MGTAQLVTRKDIEEGDKLTVENITTKRPGTGLSAEQYFELLDSRAVTAIPQGTMVTSADIETN